MSFWLCVDREGMGGSGPVMMVMAGILRNKRCG